MTARLHLLAPGLLGPLAADSREWEALRQPRPALQQLLARASRQPLPRGGFYDLVRSLFDIEPATPELPAGALGLLGEGGRPEAAFWLRADPVHLRPDRDRLMLFADSSTVPTAEQAAVLVADCNRLLVQDGLELRIGPMGGWYLRAEKPIELETTPTDEVAGRYLDRYLPRGPHASRWLSLSTELQMVMHTSLANEQRESRGQATINGLWIWGAGVLPSRVQGSWSRVLTDEPTLRGMALSAGAAVAAVPDTGEWQPGGTDLMLFSSMREALAEGDLEAWWGATAVLEREWLAPLLECLRGGEIEQLVVEADGLRLTLTSRGLRRFWRRPRPLLRDLEFQIAKADQA